MKILIDTDWFPAIQDLTPEKKLEVMDAILNYPNGSSDTNIWKKIIQPSMEKGRIAYYNRLKNLKQNNRSESVSESESVSVVESVSESVSESGIKTKSIENNRVNRGMGEEGKEGDINLNSRDVVLKASPKEILDAIKKQIVPNLGAYLYMGDVPEEELVKYVQNRVAGKWMNKSGKLVFNIGSDLAQWLRMAKPVEKNDDEDVLDFVDKWNNIVVANIRKTNQYAKVKEAEVDDVRGYVGQAKKKLVKIIESVKKKQAEGKKAYFVVKSSMDDVWGYGMMALLQRRFWSDFLYNTVMITPKFFCSVIQEIADPYCDEYLNDSQKYYHE